MTEVPAFFRSITSFDLAADAALDLADRFRHAHAAVLLDRHGGVLDINAHIRPDDTIHDALAWARAGSLADARATHVVLFSVGRNDILGPIEADIELLRVARSTAAAYGLAIIDWLQVEGDNMRSIAILTDDDSAWPEDLLGP